MCRTQDHTNPQLEVIDKKEEKLTEKKVVDPEELQFMKDMESTKIEGDAFYQTLLTESQGRIDTYNMEVQVGELKEEISKYRAILCFQSLTSQKMMLRYGWALGTWSWGPFHN